MKLYTKFDVNVGYKKILQEQLDKFGLSYELIGLGEVDLNKTLSAGELEKLSATLQEYGVEIVENHKSILIQRIKDIIREMVYTEEKLPSSKISHYLAEKLEYSYGYISNLFSDITYSSIENFIILQKIERAKQLMIVDGLTFTEIAWKLNYSSVAHFSTQFKNATGLTPTAFQRIINKRRIPIASQ